MPTHEILPLATAEPDPDPNEPAQPIRPPLPDGTPEEFPFTEPKHYPVHPDIPTQPIHEPLPEQPIA